MFASLAFAAAAAQVFPIVVPLQKPPRQVERPRADPQALAAPRGTGDAAGNVGRQDNHLTGRVGALARRFFRSHDWIARHGDCSIAALLPQTPIDDAAELGMGFCDMLGQRLVLADFQTGAETRATISAAVAGADAVQENCDPEFIMAALESAVIRARLDGGNRFERVELQEIWRSGKGGTVNCEL